LRRIKIPTLHCHRDPQLTVIAIRNRSCTQNLPLIKGPAPPARAHRGFPLPDYPPLRGDLSITEDPEPAPGVSPATVMGPL
jgi:hypothetical protein